MSRPSFPEIYMRMATDLSHRSTCLRLQVGTVITSVDFRHVFGIGYNGNAVGLPNVCDSTEPGNCGCLHSEENAIINCLSAPHDEKIVHVTTSCCVACAKRLLNLRGVVRVYYGSEYRNDKGIQLLRDRGIEVIHKPVKPA